MDDALRPDLIRPSPLGEQIRTHGTYRSGTHLFERQARALQHTKRSISRVTRRGTRVHHGPLQTDLPRPIFYTGLGLYLRYRHLIGQTVAYRSTHFRQ
jgi:hypothetical protein